MRMEQILDDAFVLEAEDIYIYADVISVEHNVAQIIFQLHHEWLDDAILESVAASGTCIQEAITLACEDFTVIHCGCISGLCVEQERNPCLASHSSVIIFRSIKTKSTVLENGKA